MLFSRDFNCEFLVQIDASEVGLRAALSQELDREEHPTLYICGKLSPPRECNYSVIQKEALAVKWAIDTLRYYLPFHTDHRPQSLKMAKYHEKYQCQIDEMVSHPPAICNLPLLSDAQQVRITLTQIFWGESGWQP